jgi:hypothetical protein
MHLSQCLGVEKKTRNRVHRSTTDLYRTVKRPEVFTGFVRTYTPKDDEGDVLPPESKTVQLKVDDVLSELRSVETDLFDIVATKEYGNTKARADVVVDGTIILPQVPVPFLLFLEKRLDDIATFFRDLPLLDPNEVWDLDRGNGFYRSEPVATLRMKKVPRSHEKSPATEHHPAQVDTYFDDVPIGTWSKTLMSGALPRSRVDGLCRQAVRLRDAVISAREKANTIDVEQVDVGSKVFDFLLGRP